MQIRPRSNSDLAALAVEIERSNSDDRWPPHWPAFADGFALDRYLMSADELVAFVAVNSEHVVGHIALHHNSSPTVVELAATALEQPSRSLAFVARMYVVPAARRAGVGTRLLSHAAAHATDIDRVAVLDVWDQLASSNSFYEASGWRELGRVTIHFGSPCSARCSHAGRQITSVIRSSHR